VTLPWWLACGYGLREIVGAAAETAAIHLVVVLVGLLWATVTDGFGRFLLWTLVTLVAVMAVFAWIGVHLAGLPVKPAEEVVWTRLFVVIVLALIGLVAVVVNQFRSRDTVRSLVMINVAILLMVSVGLWWPWSLGLQTWWQGFVMRQLESDWPDSAQPPGFEITMQQAELLRMVNSKPDRPLQLRVDCRVQGLPADQALIPSLANQFTLRWPDGQTKQGWSWVRSQADWYDRVSIPTLGIKSENAGGPVLPKIYQMLPATVADRLLAEPAEFTMKAQFAIMELESTTKISLEPGPRIRRGSAGERIAHLEKNGEQLQVTYIRHHPVFLSDTVLGMAVYLLGVRQANVGWFPQYLLINRSRNHVDRGQWLTKYTTSIATVGISQDTLTYRALPRVKGHHHPSLEAAKALDEAELVRMTYRERVRFTSELKVPSLMVEPPVIPPSTN
jgi:hypothetical protein